MLLSVLDTTKKMADEQNLTKSFWHWLTPILSAIVSLSALAGFVFYTGGSAQRLVAAEEKIQELKNETLKRSEVKYQLDTIEKNIDEIKAELKQQRRK
jgi:hypothetical protein